MLSLKCSESGPLCPSCALLSLFVDEPNRTPKSANKILYGNRFPLPNTLRERRCITRTTFRGRARRMCRMTAACGVSVLDVLYALRLVWIGEPVLAHEEVVGESHCTSGHKYLRYGKGRHCCVVVFALCGGSMDEGGQCAIARLS